VLEHAFSADNLLGLVYKIVQDKHAPIPDCYSEDLKSIVELLLVKDSTKRPLVKDLLMTPFVKQKMEEFISNGGFIGNQTLHKRKVKDKRPIEMPDRPKAEESKMHKSKSYQDPEQEDLSKLTPKERMILKKQREADAKANQLKDYTKTAIKNYSYANKRKYDEFYKDKEGMEGSYHEQNQMSANKFSNHAYGTHGMSGTRASNPVDETEGMGFSQHPGKSLAGSNAFGESFAANDRCEDTFAANDRDGTMGASKADTFKLSESGGSQLSGFSLSGSAASGIGMHKNHSSDDRQLTGTGKYDIDEYYYNNQAYLSDEFEDEEDSTTPGSSAVEAERDPNELT
jgi:hypothetical protein